MTNEQMNLLMKRFVFAPQKYKGAEPLPVKTKLDLQFCIAFFGNETVDMDLVGVMLKNAIQNQSETELDLLLMLLEHFSVTYPFDVLLGELLTQPWHHLHDRIAGILEWDQNEATVDHLYEGALYRCAHLEYESDYCEFNRKCLYALAKIGTKEAVDKIKIVSQSDSKIPSQYAQDILKEFGFDS